MVRVLRALVVDDDAVSSEAIRDALAGEGIACEQARGAEEALKAAEDPAVGAVLLDARLAGADGIEVQRRLHGLRPALRVIALAGPEDQALVLDALREGACDYLAKPLHDEELRLAVRRALEGYAWESRWESARGRLHLLGTRLAQIAELAHRAEPGARRAALGRSVVEAVAEVLGATKTSLLLGDYSGSVLQVADAIGSDLDPHEMDPAMIGETVAGIAFEEGHAVLIEDVESDERCVGRVRRPRYRSSSVALAPLIGERGPFGVLCATDRKGDLGFEDEDLALLRIFAHDVGLLLAPGAARPASASISAVPGDDDLAELARAICDALTAEIEPTRLLDAALRPVERALATRVVSLYLIDGRSGELAREAQRDPAVADRPRLPRDRGLTGLVLQTVGLVAADRPAADPRFDPQVDTPEDGRPGPLLCVPLRVRGKVLGVVRAFPEEGTSASPRVGEVLVATLSAAVRNVLLYRSLIESIDDVARARRDAGSRRGG
jgi:FixJ family two-component response regulator